MRNMDFNRTWYGDWEDFEQCFQSIVLIWLTNGWLWLTAPFYMKYLYTRKTTAGEWSWITHSKIVITMVQLVIVLIKFITSINHLSTIEQIWRTDLYGPVIEALTLMLVIVYISLERYKGLVTSGILHLYWTIVCVTNIVPFYTKIINQEYDRIPTQFLGFSLYYCLSLIQWMLCCIPVQVAQDVSLEQKSTFISHITFSWMSSLMLLGYRRPLKESDVYCLSDRDKCRPSYLRLVRNWVKQEALRSHDQNQHTHDDITDPLIQQITKKESKPPRISPLLIVLVKTFGLELLHAHIWKVFYDVTIFISPFLLHLLIQFTEAENSEFIQDWKGYMLAGSFFVVILIQSIMFHQQSYWTMTMGLRVRAALISSVYRKALRLTNAARKESASGEIVNLMAIDTVHIQTVINFLWAIWSTPVQISFSLYFLYKTVGPSVFAGFGVLVLLFFLNGLIMSQVHKLQSIQMKQKDVRVKLLTEVLNGIKVLKLYAWDMLFKEKILSVRNKELNILWKASIISIGFTFSWTVAPYVVSLATFTTFIFTTVNQYLDAKTVFVAISYFNILRFAMAISKAIKLKYKTMLTKVLFNLIGNIDIKLGEALPNIDRKKGGAKVSSSSSPSTHNRIFVPIQVSPKGRKASVSLKRLNKFLSLEELDPDNVIHDNIQGEAITIVDGTFLWDPSSGPCLKDINLSIQEKTLVAIVGSVGCGKSSLMSAILGDLTKVTGNVNVKGSTAYVPQQAWIQNGTLQDNVLFGNQLDPELYGRVLDVCALRPDLNILTHGDQTIIGEKGINLSGGQKQRVSLARAVYHNSDVYLLDDPLSAVDSHVGKHIFEQVISKNGILKDKTRVLVTHGLRWLPYVDNIIVMANGTVTETGTYNELLSGSGSFATFLKSCDTNKEIKDDEESNNKRLTGVTFDLLNVKDEENLNSYRFKNTSTLEQAKQISVQSNHLHRVKATYDLMLGYEQLSIGEDKDITEEKIEEGNVNLRVFMAYMRALSFPYTIVVMVMYICYQVAAVFSSVWLSQWTSDATLTNRSLGPPDSAIYRNRNNYYLGIYAAAGVVQAIFVLSYVGLFVSRSISASRLLHSQMLHSIIRSPMSFYDITPIGRMINRFSADMDTVDNVLPLNIEMFLDCTFAVMSTLVVICYTTPLFLIIILPLGVLYFFIQRFYVKTSRQLRRLEAKTRSPLYNHFGETISGASVIRAFDASDRFINISDEKVDFNQKFSFATIAANRWLGIRLEFLGNIVIFCAALFAVLARGQINGALVGLSVSYALQITGTLNWLVRMTSDLETNIVSVERIGEYTELKQEAGLVSDHRPPDKWPQDGCIQFENYSTSYRKGLELVLKDVNITIHPGEKVGVVGRTGAGKSSLSLAMFRLIEPVSGRILIDNEDISTIGLHDCRSKLTILPQDPVLFSGSIKTNLDPHGQYKDEDLWDVLECVHLKDFILESSQNLQFDCGDGGQNLSIGQRQLVCLARSLLKKTKILILDEATSAIDIKTDDLIQNTIQGKFMDCTVITIAHRLQTVINCHRILVLDKGEVKEFDTPENLLKDPHGLFYQLAQDAGINRHFNITKP